MLFFLRGVAPVVVLGLQGQLTERFLVSRGELRDKKINNLFRHQNYFRTKGT